MKSEDRHKLQQNALADWIAQTITKIKPYQNAIISGIIILFLGVIILIWWNSESSAQSERSWTQFISAFNAFDPAALEKVAEDNPQTNAGSAADLAAADMQLAQGCNLLFLSKASANQSLNKALDLYQRVVRETKSPALRAQAVFGLGRTYESMGKLDKAIEQYSDVAANWPDTVFAQLSSRRAEDLKRNATKEMYDNFARYDPKPAFSQQPSEKSSLEKIPEESPLNMPQSLTEPGAEENKQPASESKTDTAKPQQNTEKPADSPQSPTGENPAK